MNSSVAGQQVIRLRMVVVYEGMLPDGQQRLASGLIFVSLFCQPLHPFQSGVVDRFEVGLSGEDFNGGEYQRFKGRIFGE